MPCWAVGVTSCFPDTFRVRNPFQGRSHVNAQDRKCRKVVPAYLSRATVPKQYMVHLGTWLPGPPGLRPGHGGADGALAVCFHHRSGDHRGAPRVMPWPRGAGMGAVGWKGVNLRKGSVLCREGDFATPKVPEKSIN